MTVVKNPPGKVSANSTILATKEKVAMVLARLPAGFKEELLGAISEKWRLQLREEMKRYEQVPPPMELFEKILEEMEFMVKESSTDSRNKGETMQGNFATLPATSTPEKKSSKQEPIKSPQSFNGSPSIATLNDEEKSWDNGDTEGNLVAKLKDWDNDKLTRVLAEEPAGVVATILNCLEIGKASEVVKGLPAEKVGMALVRLGTPIRSELLNSIIRPLLARSRESNKNPLKQASPSNSEENSEKVAALLRFQHPSDRIKILISLEQYDPLIASQVKEKLYTIDDLLLLDDTSVQLLMKEVSTAVLAASLVGAEEQIKEKILRNMSKRARESFNEEVDLSRSTSAAKGLEAQQLLIQNLIRLNSTGSLNWLT